jgi:RNA polymerase sigma-B factor
LFLRLSHTGERTARNELVECFQPLARGIARRYVTPREPFEDLLQVANLGLLKAVQRFEPERGTAFTSFAVPTILGELKRHFRDCGWCVHVARSAQELALRVEQAQRELEVKTGRAPSLRTLAEYLELSIENVAEALETARFHYATSLDAPHDVDGEDSSTLADLVGELDDGFGQLYARLTISSLAAELTPLERRVLVLRFARDLTQAEIGRQVGVSQMQVSRILRRVLNRMHELAEAPHDDR